MDLFDDLVWRGLAHQWTGADALPSRLRRGPITLYHGMDPTDASLHHGNLVSLILLRRFQRAGHRPIAVVGGATGMIGDPSGRAEERALLTPDQVEENLVGIRAQVERFLDFDAAAASALVVNNYDWLARFGFVEFLRDVGKAASVNVMLAKESVRARLEGEGGISFTEFSYMLLQAYDFVHLHDEYGCELQVGGSDQFGNIVSGIDLARRLRGVQLFGLTTPLVTRSDGKKFGKTAEGTIWLDGARTSPYAFYQWFVRVPDADSGPLLRLFTELPRDEIERLEGEIAAHPERRESQRALAREVTRLVHGEGGVRKAERATEALFGGDLAGLGETDLLEIFADVPSKEVSRARLGALTVLDAFVEAGLAKSKGDARRLFDGGGAYVNNARRERPDEALAAADLASETVVVLRAGKKSFALLRFL